MPRQRYRAFRQFPRTCWLSLLLPSLVFGAYAVLLQVWHLRGGLAVYPLRTLVLEYAFAVSLGVIAPALFLFLWYLLVQSYWRRRQQGIPRGISWREALIVAGYVVVVPPMITALMLPSMILLHRSVKRTHWGSLTSPLAQPVMALPDRL